MDRSPPRTIIAIDLMRFLAALLVVGYHVDVAYWLSPSPHGAPILAGHVAASTGNPLSRVGWIGVELFFVISGSVIAASARHADWRGFLRRRALRLAPAAWVCATLTLLLLLSTGLCSPGILGPWLRSVAFWPVGEQIDGSYWTLGVECFFYLAVAAVIGDGRHPARLTMLAWLIGLVSGGAWVASLAAPDAILPVMNNATATLMLLPHGIFFALGMMIALLHQGDGEGSGESTDDARPAPVRRLLPHIAMLVMMAGAGAIEINAHAAARAASMHVPVSMLLANALLGATVLGLIAAPWLQRPLALLVTPGTARVLGMMTYPLYLLHQDGGAVVIARLLKGGVPLAMAKAMTVALMLALAWWVSARAEPLVRAQLARAFRPRRGRAPDNRPTAFPSIG